MKAFSENLSSINFNMNWLVFKTIKILLIYRLLLMFTICLQLKNIPVILNNRNCQIIYKNYKTTIEALLLGPYDDF